MIGHYSYGHVHHDYPATDILAPCGSQVVAATSGVILEVSRVDKWKPSVDAGPTRGGLSVSIRGDDGVRFGDECVELVERHPHSALHA